MTDKSNIRYIRQQIIRYQISNTLHNNTIRKEIYQLFNTTYGNEYDNLSEDGHNYTIINTKDIDN